MEDLSLKLRIFYKIQPKYLSRIIRLFNQTARAVCEGQQLDMDYENVDSVDLDTYINMIGLKTSVLIAGGLQMGAILGGAGEANQHHLYQFGKNLGIAFQVQDDYLDAFGDPGKFGKQVGGDIIANKKTFLLIEALSKAEGTIAAELNEWISAETFDKEEKVNAVRGIYDTLGIRALTEEKINSYFSKGIDCLERLSVPYERKKNLLEFVHQLVEREQ